MVVVDPKQSNTDQPRNERGKTIMLQGLYYQQDRLDVLPTLLLTNL